MAYDYYCTYCGKKLNNETVLFDMQALLSGGVDAEGKLDPKKALNILRFRMTEAEIRKLIDGKMPDEENLYACELSFADVMRCIANENNLNDEKVAELTLDDVNGYLNREIQRDYGESSAKSAELGDILPFDGFGEDEKKTDAAESQPQPQPDVPDPEPIQALLSKDTTTDAQSFSESRLREDLVYLQKLFGKDGVLKFKITPEEDKYGKDSKVMHGVAVRVGNTDMFLDNIRVCPRCGNSIFELAGTAEHRFVVFIGYQSAGKTSTILSLTHYATEPGDKVWRGASDLGEITVKHLSPTERLSEELLYYSSGIAPQKTNKEKRKDAYSSTFHITSETDGKKVSKILTFTDLPGELFLPGGTLNKQDIANKFAVATVCDAFVVCFDTSVVEAADDAGAADGGNGFAVGNERRKIKITDANGNERTPNQVINDTCGWVDEMQKFLQQRGNKPMYVPTIILFTKCRQLENQSVSDENKTKMRAGNPIKAVYAFRDEQEAIEAMGNNGNGGFTYSRLLDTFNKYGGLATAYQAALRCSPYGYNAPSITDVTSEIENGKLMDLKSEYYDLTRCGMEAITAIKNLEKRHPDRFPGTKPHNIDKLMRWVLCVVGCAPIKATYSPIHGSIEGKHLEDYYIDRAQHRQQNPKSPAHAEVDEAMARCVLFKNPGKYDVAFLKFYNQKSRLVMEKMRASVKPDSNAD